MSAPEPLIRPERATDRERVWEVERLAFGRELEADLAARLREDPDPGLSLVAEVDRLVVGHVSLSTLRILAPDAPAAGALGPIGVHPDWQGRGLGGALVRAALERAPTLGWKALFLLGNPKYYGRFGFALAAPRGLHYRVPGAERAFQCLELEPGALDGVEGDVRYADAFSEVE